MTDIPPPITADSSAESHKLRAQYEAGVNAAVEDWIASHREAITDAFLAGTIPTLVVAGHLEDDDEGIAVDTALALAADEGLTPYSEWSKDELAEEAASRGLTKSGTKDELIERLEADDAKDAEAAIT